VSHVRSAACGRGTMTRSAVVLASLCVILAATLALGGHTALSSERNRTTPPRETLEDLLKRFQGRAPQANAAITPKPSPKSSPRLLNVPPGLLERYPTLVLPPEASVEMPHVNPDPGTYYTMPQIVEPQNNQPKDFVFLERQPVSGEESPQSPRAEEEDGPEPEDGSGSEPNEAE